MNRSLNARYYFIYDHFRSDISIATDHMDADSAKRYLFGNYFESYDEAVRARSSQMQIFSHACTPRCKYKDRYWYIYQYNGTYRVTSKLEEFFDLDHRRYYHNNYFYNKKAALQAITDRLYERPDYVALP